MNREFYNEIPNFVKNIKENYENIRMSENEFISNLPNKNKVINITNNIMYLLYPGYFNDMPEYDEIAYYISYLIIQIKQDLQEQICRSIEPRCKEKNVNDATYCKAEDISTNFFKKIPYIREMLTKDVDAAFKGDPAAVDKDLVISSYPGVYAISIYRIAHELFLLNTPYIPRMMTEYAHGITGIDIHPGSDIGENFFIDHGTGVVIGETCKIGSNVQIYQGVTLGALSPIEGQSIRGQKRHPTIENNVTIYSGATILGGKTVIGDDCIIGGNVFITESVSKNTKVYLKSPELIYLKMGIKTGGNNENSKLNC